MQNSKLLRLLAMLFALVLVAAACGSDADDSADGTSDDTSSDSSDDSGDSGDTDADAGDSEDEVELTQGGGTLAAVQARGSLNCGVSGAAVAFSFTQPDGSVTGLDADYCRAVAAAVLGDAEAVEFVPLTAADRFPALASGEIDVLSRNTSQTASRTGDEGAAFPLTTFYDGQGFMVPADGGVTTIDDLAGATVCVLAGTTTALNVEAEGVDRDLGLSLLQFDFNEELSGAYLAGQCDAWTSDVTVLSSFRREFPTPDDHVILSDLITSEPLSLAVAAGDSEWATAVEWSAMLTIQAWDAGIDSTNLDA